MLSEEQRIFLCTASSGHNVILTGQAGTGKTFVIKTMLRDLKMSGKCVAVTATTGIAATQYTEGQTIHRWCGIGDGSVSASDLSELIRSDERLQAARERIGACDVLVIDECSMLSAKLFDTIELVCRSVKCNNRYFGGIQIILVGDFYQLPPVPEELYGETGNFCFESAHFYNAVSHHISLKTVFRQADDDLIKCINEVEKGQPSKDSIEFIKSLERHIPIDENTVHLFARNYKAKLFNHDKLMQMPGDIKLYHSSDEGDGYYLRKFSAQKVLGLKLNSPVMLVVNLSSTLVNGLTGYVRQLNEDSVDVYFNSLHQIVKLSRYLFFKIDPVSKRTLAKRFQIPLILSFALTIHKSQGMSIESVVVDCEDASVPGQIGVALGRAKSKEKLQVLHFKRSLITPHPKSVHTFYIHEFNQIRVDSLCCKNEYIATGVLVELFSPYEYGDEGDATDEDDDDDDDDDGWDDNAGDGDDSCSGDNDRGAGGGDNDDGDVIDDDSGDGVNAIQFGPELLPHDVDPEQILQDVSKEFERSPFENDIENLSQKILSHFDPYLCWISTQFLVMRRISDQNFHDGKIAEQKHITKFCTQVNTHLKSDIYLESCKQLLLNYNAHELKYGHFLCTSSVLSLQSMELDRKAKLVQKAEIKERTLPTERFEEGKGNIRYIGGYCVAKLKYKYQKQVQSALFDPKKTEYLEKARKKVSYLQGITDSYAELMHSSMYTETLKPTLRKQNIRQSLTNLNDGAFIFFEKLNRKIREHETFENLYTHGEHVVEHTKSNILKDAELLHCWLELFKNFHTESDAESTVFEAAFLEDLYNELVEKFIRVSASHFRKDFLSHVKTQKSKAHRKKVMEKKEHGCSLKKISLGEIKHDTSEGRVSSHLRLKAAVLNDENYFADRFYTKRDIMLICSAYEIPTLQKQTKVVLNKNLVETIKVCDVMLTPGVFADQALPVEAVVATESATDANESASDTQLSVANTINKKGGSKVNKRKAKRSKTSSSNISQSKKKRSNTVDEADTCPICGGRYEDTSEWVQCIVCEKSVHKECVDANFDGEYFSSFVCPFCL